MPLPVMRRAHGVWRHRWVALVLAGFLACWGPGALGVPLTQGVRAETDLLLVHIDTITPVARPGGKVRIAGTVTNSTAETWSRVNLHAFSSQAPILDAPTLAASAATDPADYVGGRVTAPGTFDTIDTLLPGQVARFSLSVPVEMLDIDNGAGVYWIGVHALGDSAVPRDGFADGKARTFIPFVPRAKPRARDQIPVSLVLELRGPIWNAPDGRLDRARRWLRALSAGGRYDRILDTAEELDTTPYTWLVDPGVLFSISRLTTGNPPRSLLPDPTVPGQEPTTEPEPSESSDPAADEPVATLPPTPEVELSEKELALASAARVWMARFLEIALDEDVLALPFADLDVSAASRFNSSVLIRARERAVQVMDGLGLIHRPALAPVEALIRPEALAITEPNTTILLQDIAFEVPPESTIVTVADRRVVLGSSGAAAGGPGPTEATDPLAMRQRLLSEAALRLAGSQEPVVLSIPKGWSAQEAAVLLEVFDQDWITPSAVVDLGSGLAPEVALDSLVYTEKDAVAELTQTNFSEAEDLLAQGTIMEEVLTLQTTVEQQVLDEALATLSNQVRARPRRASDSAAASAGFLAQQLASIKVLAPPSVILSSDSGRIGATLVNGLDQPVTVALAIENAEHITLEGTQPRDLSPNSRTQARLEARAARAGVHRVRLVVTSAEGTPLGSTAELPIRAAQVSGLIWLAMAGGAALLFGAIGLRLVRRVRQRRRAEPQA